MGGQNGRQTTAGVAAGKALDEAKHCKVLLKSTILLYVMYRRREHQSDAEISPTC